MLCRRKVIILKMVARLLSKGILCKSTGLIMCGVVPPLSHMSSWCAQGQLHVNIYQIVLTLSLYVLTCYIYEFLSPHLLGNWNLFVSSSSQNTNFKILKIMFVSLLYLMLLDLLTEYYYYDCHQVVQLYYYQFVIFLTMLPH